MALEKGNKAKLVLEDGTIYEGYSDVRNPCFGQLCYNTSVIGYQEIITDPVYAGKILVFAYPQIGNYGVNTEDLQSAKIQTAAVVARDFCADPNNFRMSSSLPDFLEKSGVCAFEGLDTRQLVRHITANPGLYACICPVEYDENVAKEELNNYIEKAKSINLVKNATSKKAYSIDVSQLGNFNNAKSLFKNKFKIAVLDLGISASQLACLSYISKAIEVFPYNSSAKDILDAKCDALYISAGPGNPLNVDFVCETINELAYKLPIYACGMGHLLVARAFNFDIKPCKIEHFGSNVPVYDVFNDIAYATTQHHSYCVCSCGFEKDENGVFVANLSGHDFAIAYKNVNDGSCEGLALLDLPIFTSQFHPDSFDTSAKSQISIFYD
ncbi:MAG: carbamoyl phosphate synthase small subunit, partial [Coriobacteriales bacterium]|nr:carbamoyl phosphate synthase small subunit [Coriobacteriales bacterium]